MLRRFWIQRRENRLRRAAGIPLTREINVYDSLDEQSAVENFDGKTFEEAEAMFREASETYTEDLMWMGPQAFCYYVRAAINYIKSDAAHGDWWIPLGFVSAVAFRRSDTDIASVRKELRDAVEHILDHQAKFDCPEHPHEADVWDKCRKVIADLDR